MGIMGKNNKSNKKMKEEEVEVEVEDEVEVADDHIDDQIDDHIDDNVNTEGQMIRSFAELNEERIEKVKQRALLDREIRQLDKDLERAHNRELKNARKNRKNSNTNRGTKEPSGFNKPGPVPKEFCQQPWGCDP